MGEEQTQNDTGKEGKNSQLSSIREKKNESDHKERIRWTGLAELEDVEGLSIFQSKGPTRKPLKTLHYEEFEGKKKDVYFWVSVT